MWSRLWKDCIQSNIFKINVWLLKRATLWLFWNTWDESSATKMTRTSVMLCSAKKWRYHARESWGLIVCIFNNLLIGIHEMIAFICPQIPHSQLLFNESLIFWMVREWYLQINELEFGMEFNFWSAIEVNRIYLWSMCCVYDDLGGWIKMREIKKIYLPRGK